MRSRLGRVAGGGQRPGVVTDGIGNGANPWPGGIDPAMLQQFMEQLRQRGGAPGGAPLGGPGGGDTPAPITGGGLQAPPVDYQRGRPQYRPAQGPRMLNFDARINPDGTAVGRNPETNEFDPPPQANVAPEVPIGDPQRQLTVEPSGPTALPAAEVPQVHSLTGGGAPDQPQAPPMDMQAALAALPPRLREAVAAGRQTVEGATARHADFQAGNLPGQQQPQAAGMMKGGKPPLQSITGGGLTAPPAAGGVAGAAPPARAAKPRGGGPTTGTFGGAGQGGATKPTMAGPALPPAAAASPAFNGMVDAVRRRGGLRMMR
jgi:hypothetical protein